MDVKIKAGFVLIVFDWIECCVVLYFFICIAYYVCYSTFVLYVYLFIA